MNTPRRYQYFLFFKPYGVLSQFTAEWEGQRTLAAFGPFPPEVYPVGRLDQDSEGLLLLTNDNEFKTNILSPSSKTRKTYWAQVEGRPTNQDLEPLAHGITIQIKGKAHRCAPAEARLLDVLPDIPDRDPPIRVRQHIPDTWVEIILTEGKNRQVRRMMAAMGFPVLRLIRVGIGACQWTGQPPGSIQQLTSAQAAQCLQ